LEKVMAVESARQDVQVGDIEREGDHKGEIYGGIFPGDDKPIWISEEPDPMTHYDAIELNGRALPTSEQGRYIESIKGRGALKDIFARHSDGPPSGRYFWLAEHDYNDARYQKFSDGSQINDNHGHSSRYYHLPVLCVVRIRAPRRETAQTF
jgi:hypothetical protein